MFAYCENNPVIRSDPNGAFWKEIKSWFTKASTKIKNFLTDSNIYSTIVSGASITTQATSKGLIKSLKSASRPSNIGAGSFAKSINQEIAQVEEFAGKASKISSVLSVGAVAIDVAAGVARNIDDGAPTNKIIIDATVDTLVTGGSILLAGKTGAAFGAAVGTIVPGAGNVAGAVAGFAIGVGTYILTDMVSFNGNSMRGWIKEGCYGF